MSDDDFMNQPSGFSCGGWDLTNAGLYFLEQLGINPDESKSAKQNGYKENDMLKEIKMTFGAAIDAAKNGKKIKRRGWNGKDQYVELASKICYVNAAGDVVNADHQSIGNQAFAFVGTSGVQLGWLASQADMLADDWEVVQDE